MPPEGSSGLTRTIPVFFAAFVLFLAFCGGTALAATITVCPSGCNYTSIQEAVDNASDGDTIGIYSGTYEETVTVDRSITLEGIDDGAGLPVIIAAEGDEYTITLAAPGIRLCRLNITGANTSALLLQGDDVTLSELVVVHEKEEESELTAPAVSGEGLTGVTISDCTFQVRQDTIVLYDPHEFRVTGNTLENERGYAVAIISSSGGDPVTDGLISGNAITQHRGAGIGIVGRTAGGMVDTLTIADNAIAGAGGSIGIFIPSEGVIIRNNTITDIAGEFSKGIYGIMVYGTSGVDVTGNHFTDTNVEIAFRFEDCADLVVTGNTVDTNSDTGMVLLGNITGSLLSENILDGCQYNFWVEPFLLDPGELPENVIDDTNMAGGKPVWYGEGVDDLVFTGESDFATLVFYGCDNITVRNLTGLTPNGAGITAFRCEGLTISGSTIGDQYNGLHIVASPQLTVTGNEVTGCFDGVVIGDFAGGLISGNMIENSEDCAILTGIYLEDVAIRDNRVDGARAGVYMQGISGYNNATVYQNVLKNTVLAGISTEYTHGMHIEGNMLIPASGVGFDIQNSTNLNITKNMVAGNAYDAFLLGESPGNVITTNLLIAEENGLVFIRDEDTPGSRDNLIADNIVNATVPVRFCLGGGPKELRPAFMGHSFIPAEQLGGPALVSAPDQPGSPTFPCNPDPEPPENTWNLTKTPGTNVVLGPFLGGNYWVNPEGTGWSQVTPDRGDGFCNAPFVMNGENTDYLPLHLYTPPGDVSLFGWVGSGSDYGMLPVPGSRVRVAENTSGLTVPGQYREAVTDERGRYFLSNVTSGVDLFAMAYSPASQPAAYYERPVQYVAGAGRLITCMNRDTTPRVPAIAPGGRAQVNWVLTRDPGTLWY